MTEFFKHTDVGDVLSKVEYHAEQSHYASGQALGDFTYCDGTGWVLLTAGTYGQKLLSGGSGSAPFWGSDYKTKATKTSAYTISSTDDLILCNSTAAFTITLPAATGSGKSYMIKNISTGNITLDGNASETIDGETTQILYQYEGVQIIDTSAGVWIVI